MDRPPIFDKPFNRSEFKTEKVSILMCVFNSSKFLGPAIDSALDQTYRNFELIIIDDCSTDDSWPIACSYAELDPRIRTIRLHVNQGASAALNKGLQKADGDYITRLDSDDIMYPERLSEQVSHLQQFSEVGAIGTNVRFIDTVGNDIGVSSFPLTNEAIQEALPDDMCLCGPSVMVRRDVFVQAGLYFVEEYSTAEDYDLCLRLSEVTQMRNLERPLYGYRQHPDSVSVAKRYQQLCCKVRSLEQATRRRFGQNPPQHYIDYISRDYLRAAVLGWFNNEIASSKKCLEFALRYSPDLLCSDTLQPPLGNIIKRYLPKHSLEASVAQVESLFRDLLPQKKHLERLKSQLIAEIYIVEAFDRAQKSPTHAIEPGLIWKGVKHDPRWLSNRGIVSTLLKQSIPRSKPGT